MAPAKVGGGWTLVEDGEPIWEGGYAQLWRQTPVPGRETLAAIVATSLGQWTVAVDDVLWQSRFDDLVLGPFFSEDGAHLAVITKHDNRWSVAVDDRPWSETFDMVWDPALLPDGRAVAKVERDGRYFVALDGRTWARSFEALWEPVASPDGESLLVRAIEDGKYVRSVVPLTEVAG